MRKRADDFEAVKRVGLTFDGVEAFRRYDGAPVLKARGCFMAAIASHASAEPRTLVVRSEFENRALMIEDAPDTYYVTGYYERYPVVLARLSALTREGLHDLLAVSWRLTMAKAGKSRRQRPEKGSVGAPPFCRRRGAAAPPADSSKVL